MGSENENQNKPNKPKFCPQIKSLPKKNENSRATENRGKIWAYWAYLKSTQ